MTTIDASTFFVLLLASALAGALLGVAPTWRRLMGGADLPVRKLLLRRGQSPTIAEEMRCALCPVRPQCARRVAAGAAPPLENCPNAALFSAPG